MSRQIFAKSRILARKTNDKHLCSSNKTSNIYKRHISSIAEVRVAETLKSYLEARPTHDRLSELEAYLHSRIEDGAFLPSVPFGWCINHISDNVGNKGFFNQKKQALFFLFFLLLLKLNSVWGKFDVKLFFYEERNQPINCCIVLENKVTKFQNDANDN